MKINIDGSIFNQAMSGQPEALRVLKAAARVAAVKEKLSLLKDELMAVQAAEDNDLGEYQKFVRAGLPEGDEYRNPVTPSPVDVALFGPEGFDPGADFHRNH